MAYTLIGEIGKKGYYILDKARFAKYIECMQKTYTIHTYETEKLGLQPLQGQEAEFQVLTKNGQRVDLILSHTQLKNLAQHIDALFLNNDSQNETE